VIWCYALASLFVRRRSVDAHYVCSTCGAPSVSAWRRVASRRVAVSFRLAATRCIARRPERASFKNDARRRIPLPLLTSDLRSLRVSTFRLCTFIVPFTCHQRYTYSMSPSLGRLFTGHESNRSAIMLRMKETREREREGGRGRGRGTTDLR